MKTPRAEAGFTLIELMISLVLFSFAVAGVLAIAVSLTQGYREQRQAVSTETSARVPMDFIADAIRQASPAVSDFTKVQDSITGSIGAISMTNNYASGTDRLDLIYASGGVVTSAAVAYTSFDTSLTVVDGSQLNTGDYVLISNLNYGHLVKISSKSGVNVLNLAPMCATNQVSQSYPQGSLVIRAQHATFTIGTDLQDAIPTLMMDPDSDGKEWDGTAAPCQAVANAPAEPLAEGVEDLQVAFGIDLGTDGVFEQGTGANDDEWIPNFTGEVLPTPITAFTGTLRAVRVTMIARAEQSLIGGVSLFGRPAAEDHAAGAADAFRRRVLRAIVEVRNTGVSP